MWTSGAYGYLFDYLLCWAALISIVIHTWCFFKLFPRDRFRKSGLILGNLLVLSCMLGVVGLALETHIRFTLVETDSFGVSLPARRWFALNTVTNSLGCRDEEWAPVKPPGVTRIAFVGDSFTYGWGIADVEDRFTETLQHEFDKRPLRLVEVLNVSKPGWNTGDQLQPVEDIINRYGVDEVVLCYVPNDIEGVIPKTEDFDPTRPPDATLFNLDSSCLVDYLYRRLILPRRPTVRGFHDWLARGYTTEPIWLRHQQQLLALRDHCADRGVTLRVALLPFIKSGMDSEIGVHPLDRVSQFLTAHGLAYVDLRDIIAGIAPDELVVNSLDAHPNERAHALFAEAIWRAFYERE